jgi:Flp pilus assembly protein TadG
MRAAGVRRSSRGQATIEFAIVFPIFLLLFLALLELGNAWVASSAASAAAKEAAEFARRQVPLTPEVSERADAIAQSFLASFTRVGGRADATVSIGELAGQRAVQVDVELEYPLITGAFLRSVRLGAEPVFGEGVMRVRRAARVLVL